MDDEDVQALIEEIKKEIKEYALKNVFNADKTSLFWKIIPDKRLASQRMAGFKPNKTRVTLMAGANTDGSEKLSV